MTNTVLGRWWALCHSQIHLIPNKPICHGLVDNSYNFRSLSYFLISLVHILDLNDLGWQGKPRGGTGYECRFTAGHLGDPCL